MSEPRPAPRETGDDTPYRVAFENHREAIIVAQDGRLVAANPATARLSGYTPEELIGMPFLALIHPDDHAQTLTRYERRLSGDTAERSIVLRALRKDRAVLWLEAHSIPVEWHGSPAVLAFFADVTDREAERERARERERMLERIARISPHFIFVYDYEQGRDVFINRSVPAALGYLPEQEAALQPYPFAKLCHPDDYARTMDRDQRWRGVADGAVDAVEFRLRRADGEWRWFRSLNTPFRRDASGRVAQMLGVSEDVTELKRSEEALRRGEKLEGLAVLAGGLAHDFGNLLTPVLGRADLLLERLPAGSPLRVHAESIRLAAEHAAELVDQLLAYAGRKPFDARPIDLNELTGDVVNLLVPVAPAPTTTELALEPGLASACGDPSQLRQVILNLLTNAYEAIDPAAGRVRVRSRGAVLGADEVARIDHAGALEPGPVVILEVEDDGPGVDAETKARLFEPFFSTKPRGRGLGLASVLGILQRHRAGLAVDSTPGTGTTFRVYLPVAGPAPPQSGSPER